MFLIDWWENPKIPTLYFLPKIHKNLCVPLGRPILSGIGVWCNPVCKCIDYYLKPLMECMLFKRYNRGTEENRWDHNGS